MLAKNSLEGRAAPFLQRVENMIKEGESAKGTYMAECKVRREAIKEIYSEAKEAGIPPKSLRGLVKFNELERKQQAIADGLENEEAQIYETLVAALGELGEAAARAAGHAPAGDDDKDVRPTNLKENDKSRQSDPDALAKVGRGNPAAH
jgi:uncharacterized protein (UPF0335 family)